MESRGNDEPNKREAKVETRQIAQFKEKSSSHNAMPAAMWSNRQKTWEKPHTQDLEIDTWAWEFIYI